MDPEVLRQLQSGTVGAIQVSQRFLLGASVYMEIPILMTLLSWILPVKSNRWANIFAGLLMSAGQTASLFVGTAISDYYIFFSVIEIGGTLFIAWYAWKHIRQH